MPETVTTPEVDTSLPTTPAIAAAAATADAQPAAPAAQPAVAPELLERASQAGLDLGETPDYQTLASKIFEKYEAELPYAQHGRQALATQPAQPVAGISSGIPASETAPEAEAFDLDRHLADAWKLPELSPGAQWALQHGAFTTNEAGAIIAKQGLEQVALPYLREIQEYQQSKEQLSESFQQNPVKFIYEKLIPALRHELRGDFEQLENDRMTRSQAQAFEQRFAAENKDWLFGADGNLSDAGKAFKASVDHWRAKGVTDPEALAQLGKAAANAPAAQQVPAQQPAAAPAASRPRAADGTFISKQESFLESAKRQSAASAGGGRSAPSAEDYVPANRGQLDNVFRQKFRESRALA